MGRGACCWIAIAVLLEERHCGKANAALEEKQALAKQLQLQREEDDEVRRQRTFAQEFMEQNEARQEQQSHSIDPLGINSCPIVINLHLSNS